MIIIIIRRAFGPSACEILCRGVFRSSQTAQSGRPKALGGGSRSEAVGADLGQYPAESWRPVIYEGS